jgi:hypothetical protein
MRLRRRPTISAAANPIATTAMTSVMPCLRINRRTPDRVAPNAMRTPISLQLPVEVVEMLGPSSARSDGGRGQAEPGQARLHQPLPVRHPRCGWLVHSTVTVICGIALYPSHELRRKDAAESSARIAAIVPAGNFRARSGRSAPRAPTCLMPSIHQIDTNVGLTRRVARIRGAFEGLALHERGVDADICVPVIHRKRTNTSIRIVPAARAAARASTRKRSRSPRGSRGLRPTHEEARGLL